MKKKKGSLLLYVALSVAIIAVIVVLVVRGYQKDSSESASSKITPEARARDAQRKADMQSLAMAAQIYKVSHNNKCPLVLSELASPNYIAHIPLDPKTGSSYAYEVVGTTCVFSATLEDTSDEDLKNDYNPSNGSVFDRTTE